MQLFLSDQEIFVLRALEQARPEGLHFTDVKLKSAAHIDLVARGFAVKSDGGYLYCTARGLKYLDDQSSQHLSHHYVQALPAPVPYVPRVTIGQKISNFIDKYNIWRSR